MKLNKLIKLIRKIKPKNILIHQNSFFELKELINNEIDSKIFLKTSDLKYARQVNKDIPVNLDLIVYICDPYESLALGRLIINQYIEKNEIIVIGKKKSGIKQIVKLFNPKRKIQMGDINAYYIGKQKSVEINIKEYNINIKIKDIDLNIRTEEGIFSYKGLDQATRFLLEKVDIWSKDEILDFCCGYGPIGLYFAKKYPSSKVDMLDSNLRAVDLSKMNSKLNKIGNINIFTSYFMDAVKNKYDVIISNPPTHAKL